LRGGTEGGGQRIETATKKKGGRGDAVSIFLLFSELLFLDSSFSLREVVETFNVSRWEQAEEASRGNGCSGAKRILIDWLVERESLISSIIIILVVFFSPFSWPRALFSFSAWEAS
jgi:hypothetical protein